VVKCTEEVACRQIPMGIRKNFFEMYAQFGHARSKCFASPDLGQMDKNETTHVHSLEAKGELIL